MGKINESDLAWSTLSGGDTGLRRKQLAAATDGDAIGASLYELPAGDRSWPYHYHTANEEALYVLEGSGTLRLDGDSVTLSAGDYVALPADERGAHRVVNDGDDVLRYLVVSTMVEPDVTVYPDSAKVGVFVGAPPGGEGDRPVHGYFRQADAVDYWSEEDSED
jgi:uncharacterized cupin superfamily protein